MDDGLCHTDTNSHLDVGKDQMRVVKISELGISGEGQDKIASRVSEQRTNLCWGTNETLKLVH